MTHFASFSRSSGCPGVERQFLEPSMPCQLDSGDVEIHAFIVVSEQQPTTNNHQQPPTTTNNHQQPPTTNHQPPTTNHQPPTTNNQQPQQHSLGPPHNLVTAAKAVYPKLAPARVFGDVSKDGPWRAAAHGCSRHSKLREAEKGAAAACSVASRAADRRNGTGGGHSPQRSTR